MAFPLSVSYRTTFPVVLALLFGLASVPCGLADSAWTPLGPAGVGVRVFAVSPDYPSDGEMIVVGNAQPWPVYITHDGGTTWTTNYLAGTTEIINDVAYGSSPETIYIAGNMLFLCSYDGGVTWTRHFEDLANWQKPNIYDISVKGDIVALSTVKKVGISRDGGRTIQWIERTSTNGLPEGSYISVDVSPAFAQDGTILIGTYTGVYRSTDGGSTWVPAEGMPPVGTAGAWPYAIEISPDFPSDGTVYAYIWPHNLYKSTDGGASFAPIYPTKITGSVKLSLSPDYTADGTLMVSGFNYSAYKYFTAISRDRGATWTDVDTTLPDGVTNMEFDCIFSPTFSTDRRIFGGSYTNGVYTRVLEPVSPANRPPVLDPVGDKTVTEGATLTFSVTASDPDGDTVTVFASGLPYGATFSGNTFSWTPGYDQAGTYTVTFTATDGTESASETVTITVTDASPQDAIRDLEETVSTLTLDHGTARSLTAKLDAALDSLAHGNAVAAKNQVNAFINHVEAQRGKKLSDAQADLLILQARAILAML
ncbi:MAG: putative Ig domain-containing protein [Methanolinea sp.]